MELWMPIPGWVGLYEASTLGRIRSLDREWVQPHTRTGRPVKMTKKGRVLRTPRERTGYQRVTLRAPGRKEVRSVHQLILEAFVGMRPDGMVCRHLNGDPADNRLCNLAWGTVEQNVRDREDHGRTVRGSKHWQSRFSEDEVLKIRQEKASGMGISDLARKYHAPISTINNLLEGGKNWKHLTAV